MFFGEENVHEEYRHSDADGRVGNIIGEGPVDHSDEVSHRSKGQSIYQITYRATRNQPQRADGPDAVFRGVQKEVEDEQDSHQGGNGIEDRHLRAQSEYATRVRALLHEPQRSGNNFPMAAKRGIDYSECKFGPLIKRQGQCCCHPEELSFAAKEGVDEATYSGRISRSCHRQITYSENVG